MIKRAIDTFLSDALLIGFAGFYTFIFVLMLYEPSHTVALVENNLAVLLSEIGVCAFAAVWSLVRVVRNIRRARRNVA